MPTATPETMERCNAPAGEGHYRSLFDGMLDGVAHCRMLFADGRPHDFVYLDVNPAFACLTGLTGVVGRKVSDVVPGIRESNPELFEVYGRVAATGVPERFETYVEPLGIWFDLSVYSPEKDHFVAIFANITGRKRMEAALRESEERFRSFFEDAPIGKAMTAPDGTLLRVNQAFATLLGYSKEEMARVSFAGITHPDDKARSEECARALLSGRLDRCEVEKRYVRKDGSPVWANVAISLQRDPDGAPLCFLTHVQDIDRRKHAEEAEAARRESEERLREVAENIQEVFWITDPLQTRMIYVSPAYEQIWGRTCASLYDDPVSFLASVHAEDRERVVAAFADYARGKLDETYRIHRPDGVVRWIRARGFPVRGPAGEIQRMVGSAQDITELKDAEQQLRLQKEVLQTVVDSIPVAVNFFDAKGHLMFANGEFERLLGWTAEEAKTVDLLAACYPDESDRKAVAEFMRSSQGVWRDFRTRTRDGRVIDTCWFNVRLSDGTIVGVGQDMTERRRLEAEYRQAQKMEAVGRLAGGVAHDFNNLIGVMRGYSEMALRQLEGGRAVGPRIQQVLKAADRAAALTRQLLAFSRRQVLAPTVVDLNALISDLGNMLHRLIGEDVEMVTQLAGGTDTVRVDVGQMEQVVMNLVVNARDAMPGGGTLTIGTADLDLAAPLAASHGSVPSGSYAVLSVQDTGEGIDPANMARIFEPFFTTKAVGAGTGLGLSTVYGIVAQTGGYVDVRSELGRGTIFRIYLPRVPAGGSTGTEPCEDLAPVGGGETILLAEDQEALREVIQETLHDLGYTVLTAGAADSALAVAAAHSGPIHLLLTDVVMPKGSGPQLAARLLQFRPETRVLFMSGYTDDMVGRQGAQVLGQSLIEKPFTSTSLARRIRSTLAARTA